MATLTAIGTFLASPLGKIAEWAVGILFIILVLLGLYMTITHNAAQKQILKDQLVISQQVIKNQQEFADKQNQVIKLQQDSSANFQKQLDDIKETTDQVNAYLNDPDTIKLDRDSGDIIKETIKKLSGEK